MNAVDLIIIAILAVSVLVGLWRGLISEVLALATWVVAFWVAWTYGPAASAHFDRTIETPMLRLLAGYGICFIGVLILGALVRFVVQKLVDGTGLGGTDRLLGMVFGFARGVLLVTLVVFLVNLTSFAHETMWQQSVLLPQFKGLATWLEQEMPANVREHLHPGNLPVHLPDLHNVLPASLPARGSTSPAAASSAAGTTH
ncbi:CvpA family protein [Dyella psychrodurans]|uniref:CvpA family protein n=1 Tax=Dyella psychrodurans TaxID=1927960 RepID=A0A370XBZ6_9GAMM|nr:CvpA family protein [Dyella psychrodurans]RDS85822.1 CvpA family protein [Dyella psychrodurans]